MNKTISAGICTLGLALGLYGTAEAALLTTYTHNYGIGTGKTDPGGNDPLSANYVTVKDSSTSRFSDSFDFSTLNYSSIDNFEITLRYKGISSGVYNIFGIKIPNEDWYLRFPNSGDTQDNYTRSQLTKSDENWAVTAFNLSGGKAFDEYLNGKKFTFSFAEETLNYDQFVLESAVLNIYGTPTQTVVPIPAAAPLFMGGLALVGWAGRRRRQHNLAAS